MEELRRSVPITIELSGAQVKALEEKCSKTWAKGMTGARGDIATLVELVVDSVLHQLNIGEEYKYDGDDFGDQLAMSYIRKHYSGICYMDDFLKYLRHHEEVIYFAETLQYLIKYQDQIERAKETVVQGGWYSSLLGRIKYWYEFKDETGVSLYKSYEEWKIMRENEIVQFRDEAQDYIEDLQTYWMKFYDNDFYGHTARKTMGKEEFRARAPWSRALVTVEKLKYRFGLDEGMDEEYRSFVESKRVKTL